MLHSLFLFLHVTAAMGLVAMLAIETASLLSLRNAENGGEIQSAMRGFGIIRPLGTASALAVVLTGGYLASMGWGWRSAWITVTLGSIVGIAIIGARTTGPILARIARETGSRPETTMDLRRDPRLPRSLAVRAAILLGVVFLMTAKPDLEGSLIAITVSLGAGLLVSTTWRRDITPGGALPIPAQRRAWAILDEIHVHRAGARSVHSDWPR